MTNLSKKAQDYMVDLSSKFPNRFLLSVAISKRAKQLKDGVKPLVDYNKDEDIRPVEIALEEIAKGLVGVEIRDEVNAEEEMLEEMDQLLEAEIQQSEEDEKEAKKRDKEKAKQKKSLAA